MTSSARSTFVGVRPLLAVCLLLAAALAAPATAQTAQWDSQEVLAAQQWSAPPSLIAEAALAPRYNNVSLTRVSPDKTRFLHEIGDGPASMGIFSKAFHELGGQFYDYEANRNRRLTTRNNVGLQIISAADGSIVEVDLPDGARISNSTWSPDGSRVAFFAHFADETRIYVADPTNGNSRDITRQPVLATAVMSFEWTSDGGGIATVLVPENRAAMPVEAMVPTGPQVKRTEDGENVLRTYSSLMETPYDEGLLEWHLTGQLAVIDVETRRASKMGEPEMIRSFDFSPTGEYARVTRTVKPFSYIVPVTSFGRIEEIWDRDGAMMAEIEVTELNTGIRDDDGGGGGGFGQNDDEQGKRALAWREDGQGLSYLEQDAADEDEGDGDDSPDADAPATRGDRGGRGGSDDGPRRADRVMQWLPPFDSLSATEVYSQNQRMRNVRYNEDHSVLFITTRRGSNSKVAAVFLDDPETTHTLSEWDTDEFYENPGQLVPTDGSVPAPARRRFFGGPPRGAATPVQMSADGESVFMAGVDYDEDPLEVAPRSYLDRLAIRTGERERIFEGANEGAWENLTSILNAEEARFIVSRETPTEIAQSYLSEAGAETQLTYNVDYTPDITTAPRERFVVERPDGFRFRVNVILPPGYREGTRLPAMFWFYPREYEDQESYDEGARTFNKNAFPRLGVRSMDYLIRLGYAVVTPDAPIIGKAGQMNNNYEHDLRNNLAAVIDELDDREIIDRKRLGIGGHSYGAFSTANAMVHTPFFKAGIAGDGNYNRTLTPLAFQSERRFLWDAKDVYLSMSPFMHANNLTGALLMYHGLQDQNVGTAPNHSPRLFHALNGLNKDAAMYLYPFEDHGPATRETLLDLWARWTAWLDIYLMNPEQEERRITSEDGQGS